MATHSNFFAQRISQTEEPGGYGPQGCKESYQSLSHIQLFETPQTVAHQAPLSVKFSRQEFQSGQPLPSPGDLSNPGIKRKSRALQADCSHVNPQGSYLPSGFFQDFFKFGFLQFAYKRPRRNFFEHLPFFLFSKLPGSVACLSDIDFGKFLLLLSRFSRV